VNNESGEKEREKKRRKKNAAIASAGILDLTSWI
jgi:hypothetical protein